MKHILISCFSLIFIISTINAISTRNDSHISNIKPASITSRHSTRNSPNRRHHTAASKSKYSLNEEKRLEEILSKKNLNNHEVLKKLGLSKVRVSPSHHKKRLAVESRHHAQRADDSHMFVIKLPPNPYYYSQHNKNSFVDTHKKVPVGFKSNGKPGKIYHWNIPVLKKILNTNHGRQSNNYRHMDDEADLIDIKHIPTWSKPWENEAYEKPLGKHEHEKMLKKKTPSYYAPVKARQTNFNKYFTNNGKPQSFYVIENHKPISYHKLIQ